MNQIYPEDRAIRFLDLKSYLIHKGIPVTSLNSGYIFNMEKGQYSVRNFYGTADIGVFIVDSMNPEGKSYNSMQFKMSTKALYKKLVLFDEMWDIAQMKMTDVYFLVTQEEMVEKIEETTRIASRRRR